MAGSRPQYTFDPQVGKGIEKLRGSQDYSAERIEELIDNAGGLVKDIFLYRSLGRSDISIREQDQEFEELNSFKRDFSVPKVRKLQNGKLVNYSASRWDGFIFVVVWTNTEVPVVLDITIEDELSGSVLMGMGASV